MQEPAGRRNYFAIKERMEVTMFRLPHLTGALVVLSLAAGVVGATAAETGTKTMPDSSIYPPPTHRPVLTIRNHHECYLPSEPCDNRHRVNN